MSDRTRLVELIRERIIEEDTVMIHGTSVESGLTLLDTGKLTLAPYSHTCEIHPGYLFFVVNPARFKDNDFYKKHSDDFQNAWHDCLDLRHFYATAIGQTQYIAHQIGQFDGILYDLTPLNPQETLSLENLPDFIREGFVQWVNSVRPGEFDIDRLESLLMQASKRRGILLSLNEGILEHEIEMDDEDYAVKIYLPNGLDGRYINGIVPQGDVEAKILQDRKIGSMSQAPSQK
jgi:hypothetical protein